MNRPIFILLLLATLNSFGMEEPPAKRKKSMHAEMMKRLDSDEDGRISREEFAKSPRIQSLDPEVQAKLFKRLDKNDDGMISKGELKPKNPRGQRKNPQFPPFKQLDQDKDGQVSYAEFSQGSRFKKMSPEKLRRFFDNLDRNKDGVLSREDRFRSDRGQRKKRQQGGLMGLDLDDDGRISEGEFAQSPRGISMTSEIRDKVFRRLDQNGDGFLDQAEIREMRQKPKK